MDVPSINRSSRLVAARRLSRRGALVSSLAGMIAVGGARQRAGTVAAQDATPEPPDGPVGPEMLFVQSFQSGTIVPNDDAAGRFTVTLEHGLGQTIYFSDRPDRVVGASPTPLFLEGLGFPDDNPLYDAIEAPKKCLLFTNAEGGGEHDEAGAASLFAQRVFDWLDETLAGVA